MGKHRHSKDKMFITYTELKEEWDGKKAHKKLPFAKLPYYCCSLSLSPFENPVCTTDGDVFEMLYVVPFIRKFQKNPVTGKPLKTSELIKMHWSKNEKGEYQDPISYKVFTDYTHIVCIRTSGNVYAYDTILELNKKTKNYFDLISNQPFTNTDIITIQDPKDTHRREVEKFDFIQKDIFFELDEHKPGVQQTIAMSNVMEEVNAKKKVQEEIKERELQQMKKQKLEKESREDVKGFIEWCLQNNIYKHSRYTDMNSASLTSTNFTPDRSGQTTYRNLKSEEIREKIYEKLKKQKSVGYVQLVTNRGKINILVYCHLVPKTGQNFLELCESGYYNNTPFHRLVKDFCLQGGDPTGTGSGGQSIFERPFQDEFVEQLSHSKPGMVSMANSGPDSNLSQFFITLAECKNLDRKHTVFGEVVQGHNVLYAINKNASSKSEKPRQELFIEKAICYDNPYRKVIQELKEAYKKGHQDLEEIESEKQKQRWIEKEGEQFKLPQKTQQTNKDKNALTKKLLEDFY